jgi:hypothetical protein
MCSSAGAHGDLRQGRGNPIRRVAWCTGGAQGFFEAAIAAGADAFITGEISEPQAHLARDGRELHRGGPPRHRALWRAGGGRPCGAAAGLEHRFIDIDNPA